MEVIASSFINREKGKALLVKKRFMAEIRCLSKH